MSLCGWDCFSWDIQTEESPPNGCLSVLKVGRSLWVYPGKRISLRNMTPVVSKVSLLEISPIFATPHPKILIRSFWPSCNPNLGSHFEVRRNASKFQIFALEREFCSGTWRQWSQKYPSWKFHPFWPTHGQKLRFGRFDPRASKWWFWLSCDQHPCSIVLTVMRPETVSKKCD